MSLKEKPRELVHGWCFVHCFDERLKHIHPLMNPMMFRWADDQVACAEHIVRILCSTRCFLVDDRVRGPRNCSWFVMPFSRACALPFYKASVGF